MEGPPPSAEFTGGQSHPSTLAAAQAMDREGCATLLGLQVPDAEDMAQLQMEGEASRLPPAWDV